MTETTERAPPPKLTPEELERRDLILQRLRENGEIERIQSKLYAQLMLNEGWGESMQQKVRDVVQQSGGISEVTLDELVSNLTTHGKAEVPGSIKEDVEAQIRGACGFERPNMS